MLKATIVVLRNPRGEILLLQRGADHPKHPNEWCFPGGKLDCYQKTVKVKFSADSDGWIENQIIVEETYEEGIVRECKEETGIQLTSLLDIGEWLADKDFIVKVFQAETNQEVTRELPNREHVAFMWVTETTLPIDNLGPMTREQLTKEFELIKDYEEETSA